MTKISNDEYFIVYPRGLTIAGGSARRIRLLMGGQHLSTARTLAFSRSQGTWQTRLLLD